MNKENLHRNVYWLHKLIAFFRNIDLPGFRKVSLLLPKWFFKPARLASDHFIYTQTKNWIWIEPSKDNGVEVSLYETGYYERGTLNWMKEVLNPGDVFLDIGTNIGVHSVYAASLVGAKGSVWSFEPLPSTFQTLERNIEENKLTNIHAFQCGIGASKSTATLYDNWAINKGASSTVVKSPGSKTFGIDILPLDWIVQQHSLSPKLIKIDVEGMEREVLQGAIWLIKHDTPYLIVEFSSDRKESPNARRKLYDLLLTFDAYEFFYLKGGKERTGRKMKITKFDDIPTDDNVFCCPIKK